MYIDCLNIKKNKRFFLIVRLDDKEHIELTDKLFDLGFKLKKVDKNKIDEHKASVFSEIFPALSLTKETPRQIFDFLLKQNL